MDRGPDEKHCREAVLPRHAARDGEYFSGLCWPALSRGPACLVQVWFGGLERGVDALHFAAHSRSVFAYARAARTYLLLAAAAVFVESWPSLASVRCAAIGNWLGAIGEFAVGDRALSSGYG